MSIRFRVNGREYESLESMPPEVRRLYDKIMARAGEKFADRDADGIPDIVQGHGDSPKTVVEQRIVVNGHSYGSVEEMPPDIRQTYESLMAGGSGPGAGPGGFRISLGVSAQKGPAPDVSRDPNFVATLGTGPGGLSGSKLLLGALIAVAVFLALLIGALALFGPR